MSDFLKRFSSTVGTRFEYKPNSGSSRLTPQEQLEQNVRNQLAIWKGDKPLSATGKVVAATCDRMDDVARIAFKFGGQFIKIDGVETHKTLPVDEFEVSCEEIMAAVRDGYYNEQLAAISAEFSKRFSKKVAV